MAAEISTPIKFSTTQAQETYDRLKRCLDLSEQLLQKLGGEETSSNQAAIVVKSEGQSDVHEVDSGIIIDSMSPEPGAENAQQLVKGNESSKKQVSDNDSDDGDDIDDDDDDDVQLNLVSSQKVQSCAPVDTFSSDEDSDVEELTFGTSSKVESGIPESQELEEKSEDIVEKAIQQALGETNNEETPTKADLKMYENDTNDGSEFTVQKEMTKEELEKLEKDEKLEKTENNEETKSSENECAEVEFDKDRRETLADVSEISDFSANPTIQENGKISEESESEFPVIIDETLSEQESSDKADEPEQAKNASAPATDAASEVSAEKATAEQKSLNSSFEIIETNDPALVQCEPDSENKQEESNEDEKVLETKEIQAEIQPEESSPTENPPAQKEEEKESQTVEEEKELRRKQSEAEIQAFEQELAEEAKTLKNLSDAEEKVSVANESKPEQKPVEQEEPEPPKSQNEEPISEPANEPEPAQESEPVVEKEVEKTEQPKLDDLENEDEKDSGNVSEEKSTEESIEKVKAISDDCEKAVKRTASEIEALRAEILRNILIAKELESEKQNSAENKDDSKLLDLPAENGQPQTTSQGNTPSGKKNKKRKNKLQKPKHQKW